MAWDPSHHHVPPIIGDGRDRPPGIGHGDHCLEQLLSRNEEDKGSQVRYAGVVYHSQSLCDRLISRGVI